MKSIFTKALLTLPLAALATQAHAAGDDNGNQSDLFAEHFPEVAQYITPILDARYRFEYIDQVDKKDAKASTLRTRFGFETKEFEGFKFLIEGENVGVVGNESYYSTANGLSDFAKAEDPDVTELNRLQISTSIIPDTNVTVGRQLINMGSQRFIGSQDWRQNQTTYDAANVVNNTLPDTELSYSYIMEQHNNLGSENGGNVDTQIHAVDVRYTGFVYSEVTPYIYFIEDEDMITRSNLTTGIYAKGKNKIQDNLYFLHNVEYARQSDYDSNTNNFDLDYYHVNGGVKWHNFTFSAGIEIAEGDGTTGLITAFANNHDFNGWVDKFDTIPVDGLEDRYVEATYKVKGTNTVVDGLKFVAQFHDFDAENTGASYGNEIDLKASKKITDNIDASIYHEKYDADSFSKDTDKTIFQFGIKL